LKLVRRTGSGGEGGPALVDGGQASSSRQRTSSNDRSKVELGARMFGVSSDEWRKVTSDYRKAR
jgi:hypothetical protein